MFVALLIVLVLIIFILIVGLHQKTTNTICLSRKRLEGKTVLVTGGTAGMGLEIAKDLAQRGARIIVACPFIDEGNNAVKEIIEESKNENVVFKLLDLASLDSTKKFANDILATENKLDILINNAGVGIPCDKVTADGMQFIMQVNYYGTIYLTLLLLPLLIKSGKKDEPSRIIMTSSILHRIGKIDFENMNRVNYWFKITIYGNSKLGLVLFANELTRRFKDLNISNVVINCIDPGAVGTRIYESLNKAYGLIVKHILKLFFKTPWEGAQTALYVALDNKAGEKCGEFFKNCQVTKAKESAYCKKTSKMLWQESMKSVDLSDDELAQCFKSL